MSNNTVTIVKTCEKFLKILNRDRDSGKGRDERSPISGPSDQ